MLDKKPVDARIESVTVIGNQIEFKFYLYFQNAHHPTEPASDEAIRVSVELPSDGLRVGSLQTLAEKARREAGQQISRRGLWGSF